MRYLLAAAIAATPLIAAPSAATPLAPATSEKLEQLATIVEGMHGSSRTVDQQIADLLRGPAAAEGISIPATALTYTEVFSSAAKLRPHGWLISIQELSNGWICATLDKWDPDGLKSVHEKGGRSHVAGQSGGGLALTAAMLRAWAQELAEHGPSPSN